jgi:hypothetical protein
VDNKELQLSFVIDTVNMTEVIVNQPVVIDNGTGWWCEDYWRSFHDS